uniref:Uncharacterized protein n=1 Tax=Arion vulgaris TaxID=1028688 RepID=A0A0B7B4U5_9EUPU
MHTPDPPFMAALTADPSVQIPIQLSLKNTQWRCSTLLTRPGSASLLNNSGMEAEKTSATESSSQ